MFNNWNKTTATTRAKSRNNKYKNLSSKQLPISPTTKSNKKILWNIAFAMINCRHSFVVSFDNVMHRLFFVGTFNTLFFLSQYKTMFGQGIVTVNMVVIWTVHSHYIPMCVDIFVTNFFWGVGNSYWKSTKF